MTLKEFYNLIGDLLASGVNPDLIVAASQDEEGNGFGPLQEDYSFGIVEDHEVTMWGWDNETDNEIEISADDAEVIVFWPGWF